MDDGTNSDELLNYALKNGMIDMSYIRKQVEMSQREELLKKHPYKIWKGKNNSWYTYMPTEDGKRKLVKRTTEDSLKDAVVKYLKEQEDNPSIEDAFTQWNDRRLSLKQISEATYMRNKQIFYRHYKEFGKHKLKVLKPVEVMDFREEQVAEHDLTSKAFNNLKTITRGWIRFSRKNGLVAFTLNDVFQDIDSTELRFRQTIKEDYEEVFDEAAMDRVIKYLEDDLDILNLAILLMFISGARIGEVVALKHSDFEEDCFKVRRTETRYKEEGDEKYTYHCPHSCC